jgi:hypothetical protein
MNRMAQIVFLTILAAAFLGIGCSSNPPPQSAPLTEMKTATATAEVPGEWHKTERTDPMDGTKQTALTLHATANPSSTLIVRFRGQKLEIYVTTGDVLDSGNVRVKFDDAAPTTQTWSQSTDNEAVFSPDPVGLLTKLQHATKFFIEVQPYERTPETVIFDVTGLTAVLPQSEMAALQRHAAARAAFRGKFLTYVHPCAQSPSEYCWTDPDMPNVPGPPFPTKEEAAQSAEESARAGVAFKNLKRVND